jgi:cyanophycin synthetase
MVNEHTNFLCKHARRRGITCRILKENSSFCVLEKGNRQHLVYGGIVFDSASASASSISRNKTATNQFLKMYNFPVLPHIKIQDLKEASTFLKKHKKVVVKPLMMKQGLGITVGIETMSELRKAWNEVEQVSKLSKVVEKYYPGIDHRVLVINYKHIFVVQRFPARVVGDGEKSILQLIKQNNKTKTPGKRKKDIEIDEVLTSYLKKQGLNLSSVPAKDSLIDLRGTANIHTGGTSRDFTDEISKEVKAEVIKIAKLLKLPVLGVDYLAKDINKKRYIIELNADPGIQLHHFPTHGKSRDVVTKILDMLF